jgi:hypothetical protein
MRSAMGALDILRGDTREPHYFGGFVPSRERLK